MSQETNPNVAPYFDDYYEPEIGGKSQDYYKVLFKPGFPVQARELTTLQSMLQDQVEQFGNHFFKEGAKVIPGDLTYIRNFYAVQVEDNFLGIPVSLYTDELVGVRISGESSGVTAKIEKVISANESDRGNITLYVSYIDSGNNNAARNFNNGENLITISNIAYGNTFINTPKIYIGPVINGKDPNIPAVKSDTLKIILSDLLSSLKTFFSVQYPQTSGLQGPNPGINKTLGQSIVSNLDRIEAKLDDIKSDKVFIL